MTDPALTDGAVAMMAVPELETETLCDAVAVHPLRSVTVTLYVVVEDGVTVMLRVVAPVDHA